MQASKLNQAEILEMLRIWLPGDLHVRGFLLSLSSWQLCCCSDEVQKYSVKA